MYFHVTFADLVNTPEAKPKVVLLALWITSSSVSKGSTDMTGPKISSFTQVMSSLQLSVAGRKDRMEHRVYTKTGSGLCDGCIVKTLTKYTW